ncbi:MAG: hypothetical protein N2445_06165, partial [Acidobacteria bacterium]|nr:hypothetical protein [Acidobacteriota bacterium]
KNLPSPFKEAKPYPLLLVKNKKLSESAFPDQILNTAQNEKKEEAIQPSEKQQASTAPQPEIKQEPSRDLGEELFLKGLTAYT